MRFLNYLRPRLASAMPILTLLGTFGMAGALYARSDVPGGLVGFAEGIPEALAALESARVTNIHVTVGAEVEAGQLIATVDASALDREIAVAEAEKGRLEAVVRAEQTSLSRRLDVDRETIERAATREHEDLVRLRAEAQALDVEIERVTKLVAEHHVVASVLAPLTLRRAQLASLEIEKPRTIGVLSRQLGAASLRRREVDDDVFTAARLDAELLVVQRRIELLEARRAMYSLRATRKSRVGSVDKQPGETAKAGEAIVKLVSTANRVVVCVPERRSLGLRVGDAARLSVRGQRASGPLAGRTVAVGPVVTELPARCWPTPTLPIWGREVTVAIDTSVDLVAGESFVVVLDSAAAPALAPTAGPPVAKARGSTSSGVNASAKPWRPEPRLMTIPPSLARRTRFEPSGILARPNEGRYLVVSDDTGIKDGPDEGRPWLFSMDAGGAVAAEPVPIAGVTSIDDLESITAGDDGAIYVLASQSYSKGGRRRHARSALLRLRSHGGHLTVDGEVHLAALLDLAPERATALGLTSGTRSLDIEGMTFHRGALYLGLKAPLDASGDAMIWKVTHPRALFDAPAGGAKTLEASGIAPWAHARVDVEVDGRPVSGGISELLFVDDDSLVLTSTPSTADAAAGALWRVDHPTGGALSPQLVQRFPGRKPEGLALSLTRGNVIVVFDAGSSTPEFFESPWPP
ncbi:MAG: hypothetical protein JWP87_5415 [Labilithrix sp.]|nr:hypothetical protein [Labilithrix sp.]